MFTPGHGFKDHFVCFFKLEAEVNKKIMSFFYSRNCLCKIILGLNRFEIRPIGIIKQVTL